MPRPNAGSPRRVDFDDFRPGRDRDLVVRQFPQDTREVVTSRNHCYCDSEMGTIWPGGDLGMPIDRNYAEP